MSVAMLAVPDNEGIVVAEESSHDALGDFKSTLSKLSTLGAHLTQHDTLDAYCLSDVIADTTRARAYEFVQANSCTALLLQYMSDGWSAWTANHSNIEQEGKQCRIQTRSRIEFCLERAFIRSSSKQPGSRLFILFGVPRPLLHGKGHQNFFQALTEFFKHPRTLGHKGILSELYSFDGLLHKSMMRLILGRHHMMYSSEFCAVGCSDAIEKLLLYLTNWVEAFPCAAHANSKAIEWGLGSVRFETVVDDWHIVFESLRNSSSDIFACIPHFVTQFTMFRSQFNDEPAALTLQHGHDPEIFAVLSQRLFVG